MGHHQSAPVGHHKKASSTRATAQAPPAKPPAGRKANPRPNASRPLTTATITTTTTTKTNQNGPINVTTSTPAATAAAAGKRRGGGARLCASAGSVGSKRANGAMVHALPLSPASCSVITSNKLSKHNEALSYSAAAASPLSPPPPPPKALPPAPSPLSSACLPSSSTLLLSSLKPNNVRARQRGQSLLAARRKRHAGARPRPLGPVETAACSFRLLSHTVNVPKRLRDCLASGDSPELGPVAGVEDLSRILLSADSPAFVPFVSLPAPHTPMRAFDDHTIRLSPPQLHPNVTRVPLFGRAPVFFAAPPLAFSPVAPPSMPPSSRRTVRVLPSAHANAIFSTAGRMQPHPYAPMSNLSSMSRGRVRVISDCVPTPIDKRSEQKYTIKVIGNPSMH